MKRILACLFFGVSLNACVADETVSGYANPSTVYTLQSVDGVEVSYRATIQFPKEGQVTGQAPCNRYNAVQTLPYPWLEIGPIASTRMACPDLAEESTFFEALDAMTLAEATGSTLILSTTEGREMVFAAP